MTVKHWNTGQSAARFRLQASSDKQEERLSPAALKIHEAWCQDNGYKLQAASFKQQASSGKLDLKKKIKLKIKAASCQLAPRYNSSDFEPRRGEKK